jgi:hypothetical protein
MVLGRSDNACLDFLKEFLNVSMGILKNKLNYQSSAFFLPTQTRQYHELFFDDSPKELFQVTDWAFAMRGAGLVVELWCQYRDESSADSLQSPSGPADESVEFL